MPRLLQSSKNAATRRLLAAGVRDRAPARTAAALTAALGLDALASAAAAAELSLGASSKPALVAQASAQAALGTSLPSAVSVGKWLLLGACAGSAGSAGYWLVEERPASAVIADARPAATSAPSPRLVSRTAQRPAAASEAQAPNAGWAEPVPSSAPQTPQTPQTKPLQGAPALRPGLTLEGFTASEPTPSSQHDSALDRETQLVDGARQALTEHDSARASALLDAYDATKAVRVLDREALLLRVELAMAGGDSRQAHALAQRFMQVYPTDAHTVRLRALMSAAAGGARSIR